MLKLVNVSKSFENEFGESKKVLDNLNLNVKKGEFITLLGSNGAGKSTMFKCINKQWDIDSGRIEIGGKKIGTWNQKKLNLEVSNVVQDPKIGTLGKMTIKENLALMMLKKDRNLFKSCLKHFRKDDYIELLSSFNLGLEKLLDTKIEQLSGGQRQIISLILATQRNPQVLLLDEHTAALDPKTSELVMKLTQDLIKKNNLTCLMITHNLEDAIKYGDRLIVLNKGKVISDFKGKKKSDITQAELKKVYETKMCL